METSIEQLIRKKLSAVLSEQRKRVATSLFGEAVNEPTTAPDSSMQKADPTLVLANKRKAKQEQIDNLRQRIQALQSKSQTAKDPGALRDQLQLQNTKLSALQQELSGMKK